MRRITIPTVVVAALVIYLLLITPLLWTGVAAYMCFLLTLAWSVVRYRRVGWVSGIILVGLSMSIPVWVGAGYWLYCMGIGARPSGFGVGSPR